MNEETMTVQSETKIKELIKVTHNNGLQFRETGTVKKL